MLYHLWSSGPNIIIIIVIIALFVVTLSKKKKLRGMSKYRKQVFFW